MWAAEDESAGYTYVMLDVDVPLVLTKPVQKSWLGDLWHRLVPYMDCRNGNFHAERHADILAFPFVNLDVKAIRILKHGLSHLCSALL